MNPRLDELLKHDEGQKEDERWRDRGVNAKSRWQCGSQEANSEVGGLSSLPSGIRRHTALSLVRGSPRNCQGTPLVYCRYHNYEHPYHTYRPAIFSLLAFAVTNNSLFLLFSSLSLTFNLTHPLLSEDCTLFFS